MHRTRPHLGRCHILLAVLASTVTPAAAVRAAAQEPPPVVVRVVDNRSNLPLHGARIVVVPPGTATESDAGGHAEVVLRDVACEVHVTFEGYAPTAIACAALTPLGRNPIDVRLTPSVLRHQEAVVVTASRGEDDAGAVPGAMTVVSREMLERRPPRTAPEALFDAAGVLVQKTNHGGGSPYVRGMVGNQVLVLIDGVRLNNTTFRYGPNQYLATVDSGQIERIEVVRGASGAVLFGSDALGGVINVITRRPRLAAAAQSPYFEVTVAPQVRSHDLERSGRVDAAAGTERVAIRAGVAVRDYGDLRAGGTLGVEAPSAYSELNGDGSLVARLSARSSLAVTWQRVSQDEVPRYDQVAQRGFSRYVFAPQQRHLVTAAFTHTSSSPWLRALNVTASWHRSFEGRERQTAGTVVLVREEDRVTSLGLSAQAESTWRDTVTTRYGVEIYDDQVRSSRVDTNVATGQLSSRRGLYPDGASGGSAAAFAFTSASLSRLRLDVGARISRARVSTDDATFGQVELSPFSTVGHLAASTRLSGSLRVYGSASQTFRAPNVDDVSTLGAFDSGIETPSPDLRPERGLTVEGGVKWLGARMRITASVYRTSLRDLIDRVRGTFGGSELYEGQRVFQRANVGRAFVRGAEVEGEIAVMSSLSLFGHLTETFGQQLTSDQPMRRMPPLHGLAGARLTRGPAWGDVALRFAGRQDRLSSGDRDDHRINPSGTPAWRVVDLTTGVELSAMRISGGIANVFDEAYRIHGSGVDGYGRYVWLSASVGWSSRASR